jgi:hypothetical protein
MILSILKLYITTPGIMAFSIMNLSIMTHNNGNRHIALSIMSLRKMPLNTARIILTALSITTLSITTINITTLSIMKSYLVSPSIKTLSMKSKMVVVGI